MTGWMNQRITTVIETEVSHIQLHHPEYMASNDIKDNMQDTDKKINTIMGIPAVQAASSRVIANGMIASAETNSGIQLVGIGPDKEKKVTNIHKKIIKGSYFGEQMRNSIVIGKQLAEKLDARIKSKVVVQLQETDGTLSRGAFRVVGIYDISNSEYEEMKAFVKQDDLAALINMDVSKSHEIAVYLDIDAEVEHIAAMINEKIPGAGVMSWKELMPDVQLMNENMDMMMYIFVGIILLALLFGIINTMLMVILERVKELGMLMAIGMNKTRVFAMIILETIFLCLSGGIVGILLGAGVTLLTGQTGINLSAWSEGLNAYGFESIVYPEIGINQIIQITIMVIIVGVIAALYPAGKAIKLNPAEAIRTDN
jgi:ABC-type lipoprotein release transport system permease subunit